MKKLLVLTLLTTSAFAQNTKPNQICKGVNDYNENVETKLYIGKKIDKTVSEATLVITVTGLTHEQKGTITNKGDLLNVRMFKNQEDTLRYLTSGLLMDADSNRLRVTMTCSALKLK